MSREPALRYAGTLIVLLAAVALGAGLIVLVGSAFESPRPTLEPIVLEPAPPATTLAPLAVDPGVTGSIADPVPAPIVASVPDGVWTGPAGSTPAPPAGAIAPLPAPIVIAPAADPDDDPDDDDPDDDDPDDDDPDDDLDDDPDDDDDSDDRDDD